MEQLTRPFTLLLKQRYRVVLVALLVATGLVFAGFSHAPAAHAATAAPGRVCQVDGDCSREPPLDAKTACDRGMSGYTCHGCPPGYACIYPEGKGWNGDHPSLTYYYYGVYQLSNQYGMHNVLNNQTQMAVLELCTDWNGTDCSYYTFGANTWNTINLTPVNSIKVEPLSKI